MPVRPLNFSREPRRGHTSAEPGDFQSYVEASIIWCTRFLPDEAQRALVERRQRGDQAGSKFPVPLPLAYPGLFVQVWLSRDLLRCDDAAAAASAAAAGGGSGRGGASPSKTKIFLAGSHFMLRRTPPPPLVRGETLTTWASRFSNLLEDAGSAIR